MTELETQIISLIEHNRFLSSDLKKRYIMALFFMDETKQREYLALVESFTKRCADTDAGIFIMTPADAQRIQKNFESIKQDILKKIKSKNNNQ